MINHSFSTYDEMCAFCHSYIQRLSDRFDVLEPNVVISEFFFPRTIPHEDILIPAKHFAILNKILINKEWLVRLYEKYIDHIKTINCVNKRLKEQDYYSKYKKAVESVKYRKTLEFVKYKKALEFVLAHEFRHHLDYRSGRMGLVKIDGRIADLDDRANEFARRITGLNSSPVVVDVIWSTINIKR